MVGMQLELRVISRRALLSSIDIFILPDQIVAKRNQAGIKHVEAYLCANA